MKAQTLSITIVLTMAVAACDVALEPMETAQPVAVADGPAEFLHDEVELPDPATREDHADAPTGTEDIAEDDRPEEDPTTEPIEDDVQPDDTTPTDNTLDVPTAPVAPPAPDYQGSQPITWTPTGTYKLPKYGDACRLTTDHVFEAPSNGLLDDTLMMATFDANDATVDIVVVTEDGAVLSVNADIDRALAGKSYRHAAGEATLVDATGAKTALIVDGTLCFASKLHAGMDSVMAEFSFIVEMNGVYYATGGNLVLPGSAISEAGGLLLDAESVLDIDLR